MDNSKYLSISTITKYIKRKFDVDPYLGRVYLTGEISNFRLRTNAHQYFSLKDDHAKISAIMFKSAFQKVKFTPEDGMKVLVSGRIGLYESSGSYQIYVDSMQPDGVGALYQAYEQLKKKLASEGLFDEFKKPLPKFPKKIAVVTSPSGAVIRDIITTTRRRFPIVQLVLFPAQVQGDAAAPDIAKQIKRANDDGSFDTLIIGRGGGSIEDLWPFNEEIVARAISDSNLPVISSVGHETDTTIADLVADVRAATPTAAAELAVPVLTDEILKITQQRQRLMAAIRNLIKLDQQRLDKLQKSYIFQQPTRLYEGYSQNVDILKQRLNQQINASFSNWQQSLSVMRNRLSFQALQQQVNSAQQSKVNVEQRLKRGIQLLLDNRKREFSSTIESLDFLSPLKIMSRGYTYVTKDDHVIRGVKQLKIGSNINLHFNDGNASAEIKSINEEHENE
ncbi:exodeoxyribonuclease VII large subunit [Paucilactobacillus suebicus]|uniref:Exodeoxyribonuclease 7 large subunit n=1 Tax=Paucilactobacillus suebicus DSM 5007 = KCTC 3549 TaxID=1423807 RepID=A0A0R1W6P2_9LACO|nr:exodeoxyribonuclease VII large subunit [Paucilactobacillus suebicus]KRM13170.1 exodeoxyribonuclease VII large subunit [Paucilactobacillus suebicus DSM 5007 = KCTC 3549]